MSPKIVFLVMSAVHDVGVVKELARSLAPHTVLLHHDFSQTPDFPVNEPNVLFVPDPKRTGWAVWGFVDGIFHGLRYAVQNLTFDYLQVLSPTCLPIKPIASFEAHVASGRTECDFAWVDVLGDPDALMSVGYRAFAPEGSLRHRVLRRMSLIYYGPGTGRRDVASVQLRSGPRTDAGGRLAWRARLARAVMKAASHPLIGRHGFDEGLHPYYGSTWFGGRRHVIEWLVKRFSDPDIQRQFPRMHIADEFLIATLLKQGEFRGGPMNNHFIITFIDANPTWISENDFETLRQARGFFARKFPDEPGAPIRRRVLEELAGVDIRRPEAQSSEALLP